jgi:hydroxymethylglutaryl-CoA reductase
MHIAREAGILRARSPPITETTMDTPALVDRRSSAHNQHEPVEALLQLLEPSIAARDAASLADGASGAAVDGVARPFNRRRTDALIGVLALPIGTVGPLRVHGQHAQGDYRVPLATTDAALVASYSSGARLITEAGGCNALLFDAGVAGRAGAFDGTRERRARCRRAAAEVTLPAALVRREWDVEAQTLCNYWRLATIGGALTGTMGVQGRYASGLAALYLACGLDLAHAAESAIGVTRLELDARGDLYAAVTLPYLLVGSTGVAALLPGQRACLERLGLAGPGHANALAEICVALALAGELAGIGAICARQVGPAQMALS